MRTREVLKPGDKFNKLTVLKYKNKDSRGRKIYLFKCDCGNKISVIGSAVKGQNTKSCGCITKELAKKRMLPDNMGVKNQIILGYKRHAKDRNIDFSLSYDEVDNIINKNCFYCGDKPNNIKITKNCKDGYPYNGIDRLDSNKGYIKENCVPCCKKCNIAKHNYSVKEFINWISNAYKHIVKYDIINKIN